jgi:hypothetical protein
MQIDIIPLVRKAWNASFAKVDSTKESIASSGWNPLNYVLRDHPNLVSSDVNAAKDSLPDCESTEKEPSRVKI